MGVAGGGSQPDLVIDSIILNPSQPPAGGPASVTVNYSNPGTAGAAGAFSVDFYQDLGSPPGPNQTGDLHCEVGGLGAGAGGSCTGEVIYPAASTFNAWAQIDTDSTIAETNEGNNVFGPQSVTALDAPDLVIEGISITPPFPLEGQPASVVVNYRNLGLAEGGPFFVDFYQDLPGAPGPVQIGDFYCGVMILAAGAGASCVGSVVYSASGSYSMWAQIDTDLQVVESWENNNVAGPVTATVPDDWDGDLITNPLDNCPAWPNTSQALPPWPVPAEDSDCDGFSTTAERAMGTEPFLQCWTAGGAAGPLGEGTPDAWPPDINKTATVSVTDVLFLKPVFGQTAPPAPQRYDLVESDTINITDVLGFRNYVGLSCT